MKGGAFDYVYYYVDLFVEELSEKNQHNIYNFDKDTLKVLTEVEKIAKLTSEIMKNTELLYSLNISEMEFRENIEQSIKYLKKIK